VKLDFEDDFEDDLTEWACRRKRCQSSNECYIEYLAYLNRGMTVTSVQSHDFRESIVRSLFFLDELG